MTRVSSAAFRVAVAAIILCCGVTRIQAQTPAPAAPRKNRRQLPHRRPRRLPRRKTKRP